MIRIFFISLLVYTSSAFASPPVYVNLQEQFKLFIEKGQNADFETQLSLWKTEIETSIPDIYEDLLSHSSGKTTEEYRRERAAKWFPFIFANSDKILSQFEKFDLEGWPKIAKLVANYPQVDFSDVNVVAMPSLMMFNGQVRTVNGHLVAIFGMDFLQLVDKNPKLIEGVDLINNTAVLVTHEFTHVFHSKVSEFGDSHDASTAFLDPLWKEGLAQMHSQMLVPGTDVATVLMEKNLSVSCNSSHVTSWALDYLNDSKVTDEAEIESNYSKWFLMNDWKDLGVPRAGYCLGYYVILNAMQEHSFDELLLMKRKDAHVIIKKILMDIAAIN